MQAIGQVQGDFSKIFQSAQGAYLVLSNINKGVAVSCSPGFVTLDGSRHPRPAHSLGGEPPGWSEGRAPACHEHPLSL